MENESEHCSSMTVSCLNHCCLKKKTLDTRNSPIPFFNQLTFMQYTCVCVCVRRYSFVCVCVLQYVCVTALGVTAYAVDPGVVNTELVRHLQRPLQVLVSRFSYLVKTPAAGAQTSIYLAVTPESELCTGGYYRYVSPAGPSKDLEPVTLDMTPSMTFRF